MCVCVFVCLSVLHCSVCVCVCVRVHIAFLCGAVCCVCTGQGYSSVVKYQTQHNKPWPLCQKCRWQVTAKHAYNVSIPDPVKSEEADYAVQTLRGIPSEKHALTHLIREHSLTVFPAHWVTADCSMAQKSQTGMHKLMSTLEKMHRWGMSCQTLPIILTYKEERKATMCPHPCPPK